MPDNYKKNYPDLGLVEFCPNSRSRRLRITIKPFQTVRVTIPQGFSLQEAEDFLLEKAAWLKKNLVKIDQYESQVELARRTIIPVDPQKARSFLQQRCRQLAEKYGFKFNKISIRRQKTRWGSCSSRKNINLNINLIYLPEDLRDHVLLHELVHTRIADHSYRFWQELAKYSPEPKIKNKKLKDFQYLIYQ